MLQARSHLFSHFSHGKAKFLPALENLHKAGALGITCHTKPQVQPVASSSTRMIVEPGSRTDQDHQGSFNRLGSIHRVAAALGVEIGLAACFVARLHFRSALVSALCSFSALSLVSSKNGAVLTVLSVWEEAWSSSKLRCSLVLHFLSSDSHGAKA